MALQKVSADKKLRLTVWYEEGAEHPLEWCDFPLHLDDWGRDGSINPKRFVRDKSYCEHYDSRQECMCYLVNQFGDTKKVIDRMIANGKAAEHDRYDEALMYDKSRQEWLLMSWVPTYRSYTGERIEAHWDEYESFDCKREELDLYSLTYNMSDEMLADLIEHCLTDKVKVMSYSIGYYGSVSFYGNVDGDCEGIAWLEHDEAVGDGKWLTEERWRNEDCYSLTEGIRDEIDAWAEGQVFWFEVEKNVRWKVHRECLSEERDDEDYEEEEWEQIDSCGGYYGLENAVRGAIESNNLPPMIEAA
jgi:hypothetical protein